MSRTGGWLSQQLSGFPQVCPGQSGVGTADYLGIDLVRTRARHLEGHRDCTPDGPFGPTVPVTVSTVAAPESEAN